MRSYPFEIEYYVAENGSLPFKDWLDGLKDIAGRARIRIRLDRVRLGNLGDSRSVGGGVYELKVAHGPGYRIYFALEGERVVLLLMGGDKSTQSKDIVKAKSFREDWMRRKENA